MDDEWGNKTKEIHKQWSLMDDGEICVIIHAPSEDEAWLKLVNYPSFQGKYLHYFWPMNVSTTVDDLMDTINKYKRNKDITSLKALASSISFQETHIPIISS